MGGWVDGGGWGGGEEGEGKGTAWFGQGYNFGLSTLGGACQWRQEAPLFSTSLLGHILSSGG